MALQQTEEEIRRYRRLFIGRLARFGLCSSWVGACGRCPLSVRFTGHWCAEDDWRSRIKAYLEKTETEGWND